jgi:hypothetical protein
MPSFAFSAEQLDQLAAATAPLPRECDDAFMQEVANALSGTECGPGNLHRAIVVIQQRYFDPPMDEHPRAGIGKYR